MNKPPDNTTTLIPHTPYFEWDPTKTLNLTKIDLVYLVMTRINTTKALKNISPSLLQKAIDATCGEVLMCKKILSGQIFVKTKSAYDKKCPIFRKEKEDQFIKTTSNVDNKTAKTIYKQRHPSNNTKYATTHTSNETTDQSKTHLEKPTQDKATTSNIPTIQHDLTPCSSPTPTTTKEATKAPEMMSESDSDSETKNVPKQNLKIFPKNISKRLQKQLKKSNTKKTKNLNKIQIDALDTNLLDIC
ncbi:unnamed protein product [Ceratitis capitata]|uniref:(Mediterranean fruit fly) hypothetical protein n=1 Tax=Ceratitis capitata TaxID=7213 RepID=A0A811US62_CERCA|nr:unnamed protein product [Ceratitis capitata]